jgi:SNF2 family DNA or RNA helicase
MQEKGVQRLLIICPASMVYKWKEEYMTWTSKCVIVITSAKKYNQIVNTVPITDALIVNYENLRDSRVTQGVWQNILKYYKPDGVIVDEAHRIKDRNTANFKAVNKFNKVKYRLALTGTPAPNKAWDIWGILHFLSPQLYRGYWNFIEQYFAQANKYTPNGIVQEPFGFLPGAEKVLQDNLDIISIMRKRKDVMDWLPKEESPTIIKLPCTPSQKKYITEMESYFEVEHVVAKNILEQLIRMRQICAAPAILRLRGSSPKLDWLTEYVADYPEKSIIVFSNSTKLLNLATTYIPKLAIITGETKAMIRQKYIDLFQSNQIKVLGIQTQAGKEGLTLDQADVTIFLDTFPPAADYMQAKDRMVSTTPERVKPKEIIHVMMQDTYDEQLYKLVQDNVDATDVINNFTNYIKRRE